MFKTSLFFLFSLILGLLILFSDVYAQFDDVSAEAGIARELPSYGNPIWGDFDNDGNLDIAASNHGMPLSLYHNNGDGTFANIFRLSGIAPRRGDRHGIAWGDYDNDENLDLYIAVGAARGNDLGNKSDELYKGDGNGNFINVTTIAGVNNAYGRARSPFWIDYNNDGYLDIFVVNIGSDSVLYRNNGDGTFTDVTAITGLQQISGLICSWADYDNDGFMDLIITGNNNPDRLFKNYEGGSFNEITAQTGLNPLLNHGKGIAWGDYNNDGFMDLYIARGSIEAINSLIWDATKIVFLDQEVSSDDGIDFVTTGSNVTFNLYLNNSYQPNNIFIGGAKDNPLTIPFTILTGDGMPQYVAGTDLGFFIWKDFNGIWHIRYSSDGTRKTFYGVLTSDGSFITVNSTFWPKKNQFKDTFYRNNGDGTFTDITDFAGVGNRTGNHMAAAWGDYDNDGYLDLYVTDSGDISGNRPNILYKNNHVGYKNNHVGYKNNHDGTFTDDAVNQRVDAVSVRGRHYGAAWGDYDNDGFLDLFLKNGFGQSYPLAEGPDILLRNIGNNNHYLMVKLVGTISNRLGIGAKLTISANGKTQYRENNGGGGGDLHSQGSGPIHFGLGNANIVDSMTIQWPSGITQTLTNIVPNQTITVTEPMSQTEPVLQ